MFNAFFGKVFPKIKIKDYENNTDPGNVMEMTSFYIWPIWMLAGLTIERIYRELMDPGLRAALQAELDDPPPPPL